MNNNSDIKVTLLFGGFLLLLLAMALAGAAYVEYLEHLREMEQMLLLRSAPCTGTL